MMKLQLITAAVAATLTLSIVDGKTPQRSIEIKNESGTRSVFYSSYQLLAKFLAFSNSHHIFATDLSYTGSTKTKC